MNARTVLLLSGMGLSCYGKTATSEQQVVDDAAAAIDACYHWGGEVGDQSPERNREIKQGVERDCPPATKKSTDAYKLFPRNGVLAAKLLELIDVGHFQVSASEKQAICETAATQFSKAFLESKTEDPLFQYECREQATKLYRK